jgi:alpha-1,3-rhamnosyl/mannosyltransferase
MAAGLPVVGARTGAIPELAGEAAALYAPDDIEGMADGVAEIVDNPLMRKEMSDAGREASRLFTAEACGPRLAAAYREAAEE